MAQSPKSRRSRPSRKPVTLDLKAETVAPDKPEGVPEAEPVAFGRPTPDEAATPETADAAGPAAPEQPAEPAASETPVPGPRHAPGIAALAASGIAGGLVAVIVAAGLQWSGMLPGLRATAPSETGALQARIDELESRIASLAQLSDDGAANELAGRVAEIDAVAAENRQAIGAFGATTEAIDQRLASIDAVLAAGGAEGGDPAALADIVERTTALEKGAGGFASSASVDEVSASLDALETMVGDLSGQLGAATEAAAQSDSEVRALLAALDARIASVEADIDAGAGSRVAGAIAASALKSASDRGLPFMGELESYATVAGGGEAVEALRAYAASGVPTQAQLVERFPAVANRIVASASGVGEDAGIGERLMASARSLVQVRPVGEVAGDDPGAIAARMEVALQRSDLERAIAEWESLPDRARAVSEGFAADLKARRRLDSLITDVLSGAMGGGAADENG